MTEDQRLVRIFDRPLDASSPEDAARRSTRLFVRGRTQLGVYEEARNPSGHVMTAWEAYQAYGLGVLEEAVEYGSAIVTLGADAAASTIRKRRRELGLDRRTIERRLKLPERTLERVESGNSVEGTVALVEKIGFELGLDEVQLGFRRQAGSDTRIATRLKTLQVGSFGAKPGSLSAQSVMTLAEAASVIRVQTRMTQWMQLTPRLSEFHPSDDYGSAVNPAWRVGYNLAFEARERLGIGDDPIRSMRGLVEEKLGIPVIQVSLPEEIAGATIAARYYDGEFRGVALNTNGNNRNPWVRRATLAHELAHLLYDPEHELEDVRVDSYEGVETNPEQTGVDFVEQRANAFAIAFLAPIDEVRRTTDTPISIEDLARTIQRFGISYTAAKYHVVNAHYRTADTPDESISLTPSDEWIAAENFALDYFPIDSTPIQRRGRFVGLVAECAKRGLISSATAAGYLACDERTFEGQLETIRSFFPDLGLD